MSDRSFFCSNENPVSVHLLLAASLSCFYIFLCFEFLNNFFFKQEEQLLYFELFLKFIIFSSLLFLMLYFITYKFFQVRCVVYLILLVLIVSK